MPDGLNEHCYWEKDLFKSHSDTSTENQISNKNQNTKSQDCYYYCGSFSNFASDFKQS